MVTVFLLTPWGASGSKPRLRLHRQENICANTAAVNTAFMPSYSGGSSTLVSPRTVSSGLFVITVHQIPVSSFRRLSNASPQ